MLGQKYLKFRNIQRSKPKMWRCDEFNRLSQNRPEMIDINRPAIPDMMQTSRLSPDYSLKWYNQIDPYKQDYRNDDMLDSEEDVEKALHPAWKKP